MKRLIVLAIITLLFFSWGFAMAGVENNYKCKDTYCTICGKAISYKEYTGDSIGSVWGSAGRDTCGVDGEHEINEGYSAGRACKECDYKYSSELNDLLEEIGGKWLKEKRQENFLQRKTYEDEYKREKIKSIKDRIKDLQERLEFYDCGKEEEK